MKRCRLCPYRKSCRDVCYGNAPCDFARAFDSLDRKLKWWQAKAKNAFNRKTSWWISKKGYAVARYCFTADTAAEVEHQFQNADGYIKMFEEGLK